VPTAVDGQWSMVLLRSERRRLIPPAPIAASTFDYRPSTTK
jgi:hypothetical protein